jgi:ribonuclease E
MARGKKRKRKMFVAVLPGEQVEVVLAEDGKVQEYYVEMAHQVKTKGNIYKGTIHNIDPSLQAAFINYGANKNGFLQIDEVHPEYYLQPHDTSKGYKYPLLQKVLKAGQEILVQVVKEPTGSKGAFLTSYLSLPGRFVVLTPGREQIGVSRKIEDDQERAELKKTINGLEPGDGMGVIVRTASIGQNKTSLSKDLQFLKRLWKDVRKKGTQAKSPALIYQEPDLASRAVRDYLTDDVGEIWVDYQETAEQVRKFAALIFPRRPNMVKVHQDPERTLFERFNLQKQIDQIYSREVMLPSGGRLCFDQTEALMAVDINSGKIGGRASFHEMALKTNMEAAEAIAEQLRLRDIGGQIVIDFIEMKDRKHWREVEKTLRNAMKGERARYDVGKMTKFGLLQVVRQRMGTSALSISTEPCPCCGGTGNRRNMEWQSLLALKEIFRLLRRGSCPHPLEYEAQPELAYYLLNKKRENLVELEEHFENRVVIKPQDGH